MPEAKRKYYFLSETEAEFYRALSTLIIPTGADPRVSPGAQEVGAVNYIDCTLFDFPREVQDYFREITKLVNEKSRKRFSRDFPEISDLDRDSVLQSLFLDPRTRERAFDLRSLALEGFYSDYHDPWYEGATAWDVAKFGGKRISGIKKDWTFLRVWRDFDQKKEVEG